MFNILKLTDIVCYQNCIFLYKFCSGLLPSVFDSFSQTISSRHRYNTRLASRSSYYIPSVRTNYGKFNIRYQGASIWNNIEESTKKKLNFHRFKKAIKTKSINKLLINAKAPYCHYFQFFLFLFICFHIFSFVSICIFLYSLFLYLFLFNYIMLVLAT